ncbi:MAG TPA: transposase [Spirochaetota bacterium]|nr:transposase [Spirochaetota bacterium]HQG43341.1 transposase [Spirochaetota bacterium]
MKLKGLRNETVRGDSVYRSEEIEEMVRKKGFTSKIHEKGYRGKPLTERQKARNTIQSRIRARVEHIVGSIHWLKGDYMLCIEIERITEAVGIVNLAYTMKRYCLYGCCGCPVFFIFFRKIF